MKLTKRSFAVLLLVGLTAATSAQSPAPQTPGPLPVFAVIYSRGPAWTDDAAAFANPAVKAHMQYFTALGDRLLGAAPFALDPKEPAVGMVLMLSESDDAARAWAKADPAVTAQVMTNKVHRWRVTNLRGR